MVCYHTYKVTEIEEDKQLTILIALLFQVYLNIRLITVYPHICIFYPHQVSHKLQNLIALSHFKVLILTQPLMTEYKMIAQVKVAMQGPLTLLWPTN